MSSSPNRMGEKVRTVAAEGVISLLEPVSGSHKKGESTVLPLREVKLVKGRAGRRGKKSEYYRKGRRT